MHACESMSLEAEVEAEREVGRRGECLELGSTVAVGAERFRVNAGVLRPYRVNVANGERRDEAATAQVPRRPRIGRRVRQRQLAEAHEIAVLDESTDGP